MHAPLHLETHAKVIHRVAVAWALQPLVAFS
jgi:hypothetical protein